MNKVEFLDSGTNRLSYVCTVPNEQKIKAGIIIVHAADSNRLGPHRMFVELSDRLNNSGIASIRFDMRGCGDSSGESAGNNINPDIKDMLNAINFFITKNRPDKIFLFGISRGAKVILSALAEHNLSVDGAILLSTPFSSPKAAAKKFSSCLKEYLYKFKNPESLKKLLSGKVNLKQISKTLIFALNSQKRYHRNNNGFKTVCPLFFIYGSKDPIATDSATYYSKICETFNVPFKIAEIKNANHSFFHYKWKEQIMKMTEKWLMKEIGDGEKDDNLS